VALQSNNVRTSIFILRYLRQRKTPGFIPGFFKHFT
jgi:hypothetical protein